MHTEVAPTQFTSEMRVKEFETVVDAQTVASLYKRHYTISGQVSTYLDLGRWRLYNDPGEEWKVGAIDERNLVIRDNYPADSSWITGCLRYHTPESTLVTNPNSSKPGQHELQNATSKYLRTFVFSVMF